MLNRVTIIGRLAKDPELKKTGSGTSVSTISVAVDRDFKEQNGERGVDWFEVVAWKTNADFLCKHFTKGSAIVVDGHLQARTWQDSEGKTHKTVEIVAERIYFAGSKKDSYEERNADPNIPAAVMEFAEVKEDGELPF